MGTDEPRCRSCQRARLAESRARLLSAKSVSITAGQEGSNDDPGSSDTNGSSVIIKKPVQNPKNGKWYGTWNPQTAAEWAASADSDTLWHYKYTAGMKQHMNWPPSDLIFRGMDLE